MVNPAVYLSPPSSAELTVLFASCAPYPPFISVYHINRSLGLGKGNLYHINRVIRGRFG